MQNWNSVNHLRWVLIIKNLLCKRRNIMDKLQNLQPWQQVQGIYVHIPFCRQKCLYCDFNSYAGFGAEVMAKYLYWRRYAKPFSGWSYKRNYGCFKKVRLVAKSVRGVYRGKSRHCWFAEVESTAAVRVWPHQLWRTEFKWCRIKSNRARA